MTMNINAKNVISGGWDLVAVCDIWCHFFTPALSILDIHRDHRHNHDHHCEKQLGGNIFFLAYICWARPQSSRN